MHVVVAGDNGDGDDELKLNPFILVYEQKEQGQKQQEQQQQQQSLQERRQTPLMELNETQQAYTDEHETTKTTTTTTATIPTTYAPPVTTSRNRYRWLRVVLIFFSIASIIFHHLVGEHPHFYQGDNSVSELRHIARNVHHNHSADHFNYGYLNKYHQQKNDLDPNHTNVLNPNQRRALSAQYPYGSVPMILDNIVSSSSSYLVQDTFLKQQQQQQQQQQNDGGQRQGRKRRKMSSWLSYFLWIVLAYLLGDTVLKEIELFRRRQRRRQEGQQ